MGIKVPITVCAGAVVGMMLDEWISKQAWAGQGLISGVQVQDVVSLAVGLLLTFFGSKIHTILRWIGVGILAYEIGCIVRDAGLHP